MPDRLADRYYRNSDHSTYSADIVCGECGSFVADKTQHDKFHDRLTDRAIVTAVKRWYGASGRGLRD